MNLNRPVILINCLPFISIPMKYVMMFDIMSSFTLAVGCGYVRCVSLQVNHNNHLPRRRPGLDLGYISKKVSKWHTISHYFFPLVYIGELRTCIFVST